MLVVPSEVVVVVVPPEAVIVVVPSEVVVCVCPSLLLKKLLFLVRLFEPMGWTKIPTG